MVQNGPAAVVAVVSWQVVVGSFHNRVVAGFGNLVVVVVKWVEDSVDILGLGNLYLVVGRCWVGKQIVVDWYGGNCFEGR